MPEQEEWRPIPGFPEYQVSSHGRIISLHAWRGEPGPRVLRTHPNRFGYPVVQLYGCDAARNRVARSVHVLIAAAFLGPRPEGQEVRHLDGDAGNCRLDNLAYGTKAENVADTYRHGTNPASRLTHCVNGHPFDDVNTHVDPRTSRRYCRPCTRVNSRNYRARKALRAAGLAWAEDVAA